MRWSIAALAVLCGVLHAQPVLRITTPAVNTVVNPGQTIAVTVEASGASFKAIVANIIGSVSGPVALKSSPYRFSFTLPATMPLGRTAMLAVGITADGQFFADPISVDLERLDTPIRITLDTSIMEPQVGHTLPVFVYGNYSDGSVVDLSKSAKTEYKPVDKSIVSVRADGNVTALAVGSTTVAVRYKDQEASFKVTVSASPKGGR